VIGQFLKPELRSTS